MAKEILAGSTDQTVDVFIPDSSSTTGGGLTGLVYNSSGLTCYYRKGATGTWTQLTLATQTIGGAHSDGGFVEGDATNAPGMYRLDLSDTMVATAGLLKILLKGATNMPPVPIEIEVVGVNKFAAYIDANLVRYKGSVPADLADTDKLPVSVQHDGLGLIYSKYAGAIWLDTNASNTNTTLGTDGTIDNPVSTIAAALTLAVALKTKIIRVAPGSSITLAAAVQNYEIIGEDYSLALGGQNIDSTHFHGATDVTGIGIASTTQPSFHNCQVGVASAATIDGCTLWDCKVKDFVCRSTLDSYTFNNCDGSDGEININNLAAIAVDINNWSGKLTISNSTQETAVIGLTGNGQFVEAASSTAGSIIIAGNWKLTYSGSMTRDDTAVWNESQNVTNVTGTVAELGAQAKADVNEQADQALTDAGVTTTRTAYLDKLNISGNVAASTEVLAIQNNTRVVRSVPTIIERPDSGTQTYRIEVLLYDNVGNMEAPDSAPTIALVDQGGTDLSSRLDSTTMTLVSAGRYRAIYTASDTDDLEQLNWSFSVVEGGNTRIYGNTTLIVDTTAVDFTSADRTKLEAIHTKLPSKTYITGTANADGDIDAADVNGLNNLSQADIRTAVGLTAANLDTQLDALPTNAELATAIITGLTTALTEGYRSTGATGSVRDILYEILALMINMRISGTTMTTEKLDKTTTAKTYTLDSSTTPTSIEELS